MKQYLVGGAIRDELLGRPIKERDWCVVGADVETMLASGFKPVGKDFPVFLHPDTGEEYALARTERKSGKGYHGFVFHTDPSVTIEQDLLRRDLTINAMARLQGKEILIDPYGGQKDLQDKILRHVSEAFVEDPLRVLRLARFAAYFPEFQVAEETTHLIKIIADSGELATLVAERVWQELHKALTAESPKRFFEVLEQGGALHELFPEFDTIDQVFLNQIDQITQRTSLPEVRFAAIWGQLSETSLADFNARVRMPSSYFDLAELVCCHGVKASDAASLSAEAILALFNKLDAFRRPDRFELWLQACEAGGAPLEAKNLLHGALSVSQDIDVASLQSQGFEGQALGQAIHQNRLDLIRQYLAHDGRRQK